MLILEQCIHFQCDTTKFFSFLYHLEYISVSFLRGSWRTKAKNVRKFKANTFSIIIITWWITVTARVIINCWALWNWFNIWSSFFSFAACEWFSYTCNVSKRYMYTVWLQSNIVLLFNDSCCFSTSFWEHDEGGIRRQKVKRYVQQAVRNNRKFIARNMWSITCQWTY